MQAQNEMIKQHVELLNGELNEKLTKFLNRKLGLDNTYKARGLNITNDIGKHIGCPYIGIETQQDKINLKTRHNKLLRLLFAATNLDIRGFAITDNMWSFSVSLYYRHNDNGANGKTLMWFSVDSKTGKIKQS